MELHPKDFIVTSAIWLQRVTLAHWYFRSSSSSGLERLLQEKDQQVAELLDEGEKLSKQQLTSNNIIKKLRAKEKDNDSLIKSHK